MDDADSPNDERPFAKLPLCAAISLLGMGAVAVLAVHLPERVKLLLLLPMVVGFCGGLIPGFLAGVWHIPSAPRVWVLVGGCVAVAYGVHLYEGQRTFEAGLRAYYSDDPGAALLQTAGPDDDPEQRALIQNLIAENRKARAQKLAAITSWREFLRSRLSLVHRGAIPTWGLVAYVALEALLVVAAGLFGFRAAFDVVRGVRDDAMGA